MKAQRAIYVPGLGRWVSIGAYVRAIKIVKANLDATFKHSLCERFPAKGRDIMREFREGMFERINDGIPYVSRGQGGDT